jgi:phage antirepressor YoqD-like protein
MVYKATTAHKEQQEQAPKVLLADREYKASTVYKVPTAHKELQVRAHKAPLVVKEYKAFKAYWAHKVLTAPRALRE